MIDFQLIADSFPKLLQGATVSVEIAGLSCLIGITIGTLIGLIQSGKNKFLNILAFIYVTLFRGTPMLIQLTFAFFLLPEIGIFIPAFWTAVLTIGLNSGAYVSQIIKSGIKSVGIGQLEAAQALGFNKFQITRYILLPQAIRTVIPALGNEFITLIKDSSLASVITVVELTKEGSLILSKTFDAITIYSAIAFIYLVMTGSLSIVVSIVDRKLSRHVRN